MTSTTINNNKPNVTYNLVHWLRSDGLGALWSVLSSLSVFSLLSLPSAWLTAAPAPPFIHPITTATHPPLLHLTKEFAPLNSIPPHNLVALTVTINKPKLTIGETLTYTLTLTHPAGLELIKPDPAQDFGAFEQLSHHIYPAQTTQGITQHTIAYTLTTYQTTTAIIPPIEVTLIVPPAANSSSPPPFASALSAKNAAKSPPTTTSQYTLKSPPIPLPVQSLIENTDEDHDPFKTPYTVSGTIPTATRAWGGGLLALLLLGCLLSWYQRRRYSPPPPPPLPYYERAATELYALLSYLTGSKISKKNAALVTTKQLPPTATAYFYEKLSTLLRTYLKEKYSHASLLALTTTELKDSQLLHAFKPAERKNILQFLLLADKLKFAGKMTAQQPPHPLPLQPARYIVKLLQNLIAAERNATAPTLNT